MATTYRDQLERWFGDARRSGLLDVKIFPGDNREPLREDVAREVFEAVTGARESYSLTERPI